MSTRSQVIIKDEYDEQWFYRHSDGYPEGNMPQLFKFMTWIEKGKIRRNTEQSCGWLVLIGAEEYKSNQEGNPFNPTNWKCGAYEPCSPEEHGDIEWLYTIDLETNTITVEDTNTRKNITFTYNELVKMENFEQIEKQFE